MLLPPPSSSSMLTTACEAFECLTRPCVRTCRSSWAVTTPSPSASRRLKAARKCGISSSLREGTSAAMKRLNSTAPRLVWRREASSASATPSPACIMPRASSQASRRPLWSVSKRSKISRSSCSSPTGSCDATTSNMASTSALERGKFTRQSSSAGASGGDWGSSSRLSSQSCASTWPMATRDLSWNSSILSIRSRALSEHVVLERSGPRCWRAT
mmetsp:Transcript_5763/g.15531  ORF Transcript_5763/g.15531 Transcript_5763/m.15531 type:complete len:215 (+) Transcript_5763:227-871(+)